MAYVAVGNKGTEFLFISKPLKLGSCWIPLDEKHSELPKGTIKKLVGFDMEWEDSPIELT